MGKALLIFLLGSMAIFGVINIFNNNNIKNALNTSVSYYSDTQARNIGNSAMQMILSQLSDSNSWRVSSASPQTINLFNGSANYYIKDTSFAGDSLVKVNVLANYRGTQKTIISYFKSPQSASSPSSYALFSGGSLNVNGGINVSSPTGVNANVFSNGNININGGGNNSIAGFLNYTGTLNANGFKLSNIIPPVNPNGLPAYGQSAAVPAPTFDPAYYQNLATYQYPPNATINNLTIHFSTNKATPSVYYAPGDLNLNGVKFDGYGVICVNGNLNLNGIVANTNPNGSSLALFVVKNVNANSANIQLNIFSMGQINYNGGLNVNGSIVAGSTGSFNGSLNINYNPAVSSVLPPSWNTAQNRPSDVRYYLE
ncbi:MAG: hypothetical protein P4L35_02825 [Ignavibacteriaceae bacterium]|nr:hypothetical protein [Ignavibacteriaceae bacterium]